MTTSVDDFKVRFPEFKDRNSAQLSATLTAVELRVSSSFGDIRDEVVYLELADTLSQGGQGRPSRKQKDGSGQTTYAVKLAELTNTHALWNRLAT